MPVVLCCPIHRDSVRPDGDGLSAECGERYPVVDGIPVMLPDEAERKGVATTQWHEGGQAATAADFYNQTRDHDRYYRSQLQGQQEEIERWQVRLTIDGPTLEIGSGKGALQGAGGDYVALDYSLTALRTFVRPEHQRVCGTADRLPFPDASFRFVFSIAALEHVPGAGLAFEEIDRVLKPGGIAMLQPAWHCTQFACEGIPVRPYADLSPRQKLVKVTLPVRQMPVAKAMGALPRRLLRRGLWSLGAGGKTKMRIGRLRPDYTTFWMSDSDAAARLDSHEGCLFFHSRAYEMLSPGQSALRQLLARHISLVVRKPN